ncbi:MAG: VOC family protein [Mariniblastus sp.]|nr:VOC family protein [Mariniblastus sp.]
MCSLSAILETVLYCPDLRAARHFYGTVLGLSEYSHQPGEYLFYRVGQGMLLLFNPDRSRQKNLAGATDQPPGHGCSGSGHMAFAIEPKELPEWQTRLVQHQVPIESQVDWPAGGQSIYFRDPAGNSIELATRDIWP